jgi:hypothetical protein
MKTPITLILLTLLFQLNVKGQRNCGQAAMYQHLETMHPGALSVIEENRVKVESGISAKQKTNSAFYKTTETAFIPVVFHFVIDSAQFKQLNGISGIEQRIKSQMKVINDDFNGNNTDKIKVPSVWTPIFATVGLEFGLARIDPSGNPTPGYDIKIVPNGKTFIVTDGAKAAKFAASGGTDAWDNTKYLNIWIANIKDGGSNILGVTVPPATPFYTAPEYGITLNTYSFGVRSSWSETFITNIDKGRTLTHELGHFFYLVHTWGDDNGLCIASGGSDDDIADTPEEADATFGDPTFPRFDACTPAGNGIMFMNYMDYTNDSSMYMFTAEQAAIINKEISAGGRSYSLTLNKYLGDTQYNAPIAIRLFPNPTQGILTIEYDFTKNPLKKIEVYNILGQRLIEISNQNINAIDMRAWAKGLYFVHCQFEKETIKQKIILE